MTENVKIQNSGISGAFAPKHNNSGPSGGFLGGADTLTKKTRELNIKAPVHNFAQEALPHSMGINRMNPTLELFEMTINGLLVPGLHLGYAAMNAPMRKVDIMEFKQNEKVVYSAEPNKCPWPVITMVDGEILYLFGQIPGNSKTIEARFISWKKIKELGTAYEKTRAMIQERKAAIEAARATAAAGEQAPAAEEPTATTTENEGQQPLDQAN